MQLNTLRLDNLIIHRIPRKGTDGADGPVLSDVADPQTPDVRAFFRQRMSGVLATKGLPIERDPETDETTTVAIGAILADGDALVEASRGIAQRLYEVQDRRSPEGILLVAIGQVDEHPCVGVLKLEHEKGVRAEEEQARHSAARSSTQASSGQSAGTPRGAPSGSPAASEGPLGARAEVRPRSNR